MKRYTSVLVVLAALNLAIAAPTFVLPGQIDIQPGQSIVVTLEATQLTDFTSPIGPGIRNMNVVLSCDSPLVLSDLDIVGSGLQFSAGYDVQYVDKFNDQTLMGWVETGGGPYSKSGPVVRFKITAPQDAQLGQQYNLTTVAKRTSSLGDNDETVQAYAKILVVSEPPPFTAETLTLQPGMSASALNFNWYSDDGNANNTSVVQIAHQSDMTSDVFPADSAITITGTMGNAAIGKSWHKAGITGLDLGTKYVYRVSNDGTNFSEVYSFTTGTAGNFQFITVGDPQVSSGNQDSQSLWPQPVWTTRAGWQYTQDRISAYAPNARFIAGTGDQVDSGIDEALYANYFAPEQLRSLPVAPAVGNHEGTAANFSWHYNLPNQSAGSYFGNYWYRYNNTLFVVLNTSASPSTTTINNYITLFDTTLAAATTANPGVKWIFVQHHKSTTSPASHQADADVLIWAPAIETLMDKYHVDFVLSGHDHVYSRSWNIYNHAKVESIDYSASRVFNPQGTLYFTLNTASGLKYYDIPTVQPNNGPVWVNGKPWYCNIGLQIKVPQFTTVDVSANSVTFTIYRVDTMAVLDTYTVVKAGHQPGDFNNDYKVDQVDVSFLLSCFTGPEGSVTEPCQAADMNNDGVIDMVDFAIHQRCQAAEFELLNPNCADD